jgi:hypothetical protein
MLQTKLWTALCGAVLFCGLGYAQSTPTPPTPPAAPSPADMAAHEVAHLTRILSLSPDQQSKATQFFTTAVDKAATNRTNMQSAREALTKAIEANDAGAITSAAQQIGSLTAEQIETRATAEASLYNILNSDQKTKYQVLLAMGPHGFGPHGGHAPGAPPPPPPPPAE